MKIVFSSSAQPELQSAYNFYKGQLPGLGDLFFMEVDKIIQLILKYPDIWKSVSPNVNRAILDKFPYLILYKYEPEVITILAISHQHRKPNF